MRQALKQQLDGIRAGHTPDLLADTDPPALVGAQMASPSTW